MSVTAGGAERAAQRSGPDDRLLLNRYQAWYDQVMWPVNFLPAARQERDNLPAAERAAL
jgi:hypothetical protein